MNKITKHVLVTSALLLPLLASAQAQCPGGLNSICGILQRVDGVLRSVIPTLMVLATVVFLWGVIRYITSGGDEEKLADSKRFIIFGLVGLFIMVAIWALVRAVLNTFVLETGGIPQSVF